jgi:hypothetical protein
LDLTQDKFYRHALLGEYLSYASKKVAGSKFLRSSAGKLIFEKQMHQANAAVQQFWHAFATKSVP